MFKHDLLLTTALLAVAASSPSAARPGEFARSFISRIAAGPIRDANDEFVCQYGGFGVSAAYGGGVGGSDHLWTHVAFPTIGTGKAVKRIEVKEEHAPSTYRPEFSVGIYSNSPSGLPGSLIVGGSAKAPKAYRTVTIDISPTTLKRNERYWIVEEVGYPPYDHLNDVCWKSRRNTMRRAYVQKYYYWNGQGQSGSSTTPWTEQTTGAYLLVK